MLFLNEKEIFLPYKSNVPSELYFISRKATIKSLFTAGYLKFLLRFSLEKIRFNAVENAS